MKQRIGRYSGYLRPISYAIDFFIIAFFAYFLQLNLADYGLFFAYLFICWLIFSLKTKFYEVYRFTRVTRILSLIAIQTIVFALVVFAFYGFTDAIKVPNNYLIWFVVAVMSSIGIAKLSVYYLLKRYRKVLGGNFRNTIIIGNSKRSLQLYSFFENNPDYGYKCQKVFQIKEPILREIFSYVIDHDIDEIYASVGQLSDEQVNLLIDFADNNLKVLKFIPDNKDVYSKQIQYDYYGVLPIISLRKIPLDDNVNRIIKRTFDFVFATVVLVGLLSWLTPLLAIIIKIESKGPVFFKQKRNGRNNKEFYCFKYRSMKPNPEADIHQVRKNDRRITAIGRFMRKTSIDELPQFYNVLLGDMSVVGPRPHMVSHTNMYAESIDKFMVRHFVKPGITGLAQVNGYRGEVETEQDIINRVKYDIFYLENWSVLMDSKVIIQTLVNAIKGDKKAY
ncbi:putative colanic acid biosysnthesis UDP-glucose lipid carrier transferase [Psychroflexus salarius]|uniref:Putative colanic acid biosysnthesis UDP-glucose lipid carrier transferase n=1 Tax=Psychroflexus salarius TaxID=1155689 RepID=A0A1M4UTT9_9FLAO|nr:exopolysaccharide biosynthesis polyprenyl glycosylphosphotransferase [Psychroflexus salarius]SHE60010.1 putative colanic acid biosysnthesis UDP-glucose lipid carrier transferase [Psychroflexus salarius]